MYQPCEETDDIYLVPEKTKGEAHAEGPYDGAGGAPGGAQGEPRGSPGGAQGEPRGSPGGAQGEPRGSPGGAQGEPRGSLGRAQGEPTGAAKGGTKAGAQYDSLGGAVLRLVQKNRVGVDRGTVLKPAIKKVLLG